MVHDCRSPRLAGRIIHCQAMIRLTVIAGCFVWGSVSPGLAQMATPGVSPLMGGNRAGPRMGQDPNEVHIPPSLPVVRSKDPWPRLDKGAVLCSSKDDLMRFQGGAAGAPPDCHVIRERTAIKILERDGPSRTHIAATDDPRISGWTNVFLSVDPPPSTTTPDGRANILPGGTGGSPGGRPGH